eukprot:scaffold42879_cov114-Cyclotella_meneghiniana.AAC.1
MADSHKGQKTPPLLTTTVAAREKQWLGCTNYGRLPGPPPLGTTLYYKFNGHFWPGTHPISQNYPSYYHQAPLIPTQNLPQRPPVSKHITQKTKLISPLQHIIIVNTAIAEQSIL